MLSADAIRTQFRKYVPRGHSGQGRVAFVEMLEQALGLRDERGRRYVTANGDHYLRRDRQAVAPERFSLAALAEAIVGPGWQKVFHPETGGQELKSASRVKMLTMEQHGDNRRALLEATGAGVDPTSFLNINTFTAVVGGLVEVKILEKFKNPGFIMDRVYTVTPTKLNGQKVIGVTRIGDLAEKRGIGLPHKRAQFAERFVTTPETRENALAVDVYKETVFFDLTGQVLDESGAVGEAIGYRRELEQTDTFLQVGSYQSFKYMDVGSLSLYSTSVSPPAGFATAGVALSSWYLNDITSNELLDWTNINAALMYYKRLNDPHTGKRILQEPTFMLVNIGKEVLANLIVNATSTETRQAGGNTQATAPQLNIFSSGGPAIKQRFEILSSPLVEQRLTDSDGGNLSIDNANKYWWLGSPEWGYYMQNWPLTVTQAPPNQYEMLDKGIAATYFANERGIPAIIRPWAIQRNRA